MAMVSNLSEGHPNCQKPKTEIDQVVSRFPSAGVPLFSLVRIWKCLWSCTDHRPGMPDGGSALGAPLLAWKLHIRVQHKLQSRHQSPLVNGFGTGPPG